MGALYSVLQLTDLTLSASAAALGHERDALLQLKSRLGNIKQRVLKHKGIFDYHVASAGLESGPHLTPLSERHEWHWPRVGAFGTGHASAHLAL